MTSCLTWRDEEEKNDEETPWSIEGSDFLFQMLGNNFTCASVQLLAVFVQHHGVGISIEFFKTEATIVFLLNLVYRRFQRWIPQLIDITIVDGRLKAKRRFEREKNENGRRRKVRSEDIRGRSHSPDKQREAKDFPPRVSRVRRDNCRSKRRTDIGSNREDSRGEDSFDLFVFQSNDVNLKNENQPHHHERTKRKKWNVTKIRGEKWENELDGCISATYDELSDAHLLVFVFGVQEWFIHNSKRQSNTKTDRQTENDISIRRNKMFVEHVRVRPTRCNVFLELVTRTEFRSRGAIKRHRPINKTKRNE